MAESATGERPEFRRAHLATLFLQAHAPLSTDELIAQVYNNPTNLELGKKELSPESAYKALKRDIEALKATGLVIESVGKADDGQKLWSANRELSYMQGVALSEEDAVFLDIACLPLLDDPGFAERDELRLALAKIDRLFDAAATDALTANSLRDSAVLVTVREALNTRTALDIAYVPRDGVRTKRRVAPLAFFDVRSVLYVVCAKVDDSDELVSGAYRTYRVDRIADAKRLERIGFDVPDDFNVNDYRKLPFQIGSDAVPCTFSVPDDVAASIRTVAGNKGTFSQADGRLVWQIDAADIDDAAAWAIAYGIIPLEPAELVSAWRARLEEACRG